MTAIHARPAPDLRTIARRLLQSEGPETHRAVPALVAVLRTAHLLEMPPSHLLRELSAEGLDHFCTQLRRVPDAEVQRYVGEFLLGADEPPQDPEEDRLLFSAWNALLHRAFVLENFDARLDAELETLTSRGGS